MIDQWLNQIFRLVDETKPLFIAFHFQELGGKNYVSSIDLLDGFTKLKL